MNSGQSQFDVTSPTGLTGIQVTGGRMKHRMIGRWSSPASGGHGHGFGSGSSDPDPNPGKPAPAPAGSRVSTGCGSKVIRALGTHRQAPRYSLGHYCPVTTTGNWFVLLEMESIHLSGLYNYFFKLICGIQWYFVRNRHGVVI